MTKSRRGVALTAYDNSYYQLHSHAKSTGRAAAFGQLPCFFALVARRGL